MLKMITAIATITIPIVVERFDVSLLCIEGVGFADCVDCCVGRIEGDKKVGDTGVGNIDGEGLRRCVGEGDSVGRVL